MYFKYLLAYYNTKILHEVYEIWKKRLLLALLRLVYDFGAFSTCANGIYVPAFRFSPNQLGAARIRERQLPRLAFQRTHTG